MRKRNIHILTAALLAISMNACTKLDETVYSQLSAGNFYNNRVEVMSAVLRPFTHAQAWLAPTGQRAYYYVSEMAADQLAWPQKGRHGYDGGDHIRLHYHTWTKEENNMWDPWRLIWTGIGFNNSALTDLEPLDFTSIGMTEADKASILAEIKVLRAFHYMKLMDAYGNVPIITKVGEPVNPPTAPRAEVFAFVEKELKENVDLLQPLSAAVIGRVSQAAGYAMLAELYLNAEVWSGTARWDDCIAACDKVISGQTGGLNGPIALDPNITDAFKNSNHLSKENIFQFAFDNVAGFRMEMGGFYWGYDQSLILGGGGGGWNAFVVIPTAFNAYADNDLRKKDWFLFGPQYRYGTTTPLLGTEEWNNQPFVLVNNIRRNSEGETGEGGMTKGEENSGARFNKYRTGTFTDPNYWNNDYVIYRLTEIYFNKAEALMRKNGGAATQPAVDLINASRQRAFAPADWAANAYTTTTLTMDELLAERGREFIFEGKRRMDLIRFGKFTTATWWDHQPSAPYRALFPIPQRQIASNPNLEQNPGYE